MSIPLSMNVRRLPINESDLPGKNKGTVLSTTFKSEPELWNDFLRGHDSALASFYRIYANKLFNYGRQIIADDEVVIDAIQDLFIELIEKRDKLGPTTSVKNYLYASLRRRLIRIKQRGERWFGNRDRSDMTDFHIALIQDEHTPFDQFSYEQIKLLEEACNTLPARQREAILLMFFENLHYEDIAKIMNISKVRSARALVYRAIENLRTALGPFKHELLTILFIAVI